MNRSDDKLIPDASNIFRIPKIGLDNLMGTENMKEIAAIYEKHFGVPESKTTVGDITHLPLGTVTDPTRLESEILALTPANVFVRIVDNIQKLLQRHGFAKTDGRLRTLGTMRMRYEFSFVDNEEYRVIIRACARRDSRAKIGRLFHAIRERPLVILSAILNYIITHANQLFLMVVASAAGGVIALVVSHCFLSS